MAAGLVGEEDVQLRTVRGPRLPLAGEAGELQVADAQASPARAFTWWCLSVVERLDDTLLDAEINAFRGAGVRARVWIMQHAHGRRQGRARQGAPRSRFAAMVSHLPFRAESGSASGWDRDTEHVQDAGHWLLEADAALLSRRR